MFTPKSAALFIATGTVLFFYFRYEKAKLLEERGMPIFICVDFAVKFTLCLEKERASKSYGRPQIGGRFSLVTPSGETFTEKNLLGKWSMLYFGFTNCPDICPEELDKMTAVLNVIGALEISS